MGQSEGEVTRNSDLAALCQSAPPARLEEAAGSHQALMSLVETYGCLEHPPPIAAFAPPAWQSTHTNPPDNQATNPPQLTDAKSQGFLDVENVCGQTGAGAQVIQVNYSLVGVAENYRQAMLTCAGNVATPGITSRAPVQNCKALPCTAIRTVLLRG